MCGECYRKKTTEKRKTTEQCSYCGETRSGDFYNGKEGGRQCKLCRDLERKERVNEGNPGGRYIYRGKDYCVYGDEEVLPSSAAQKEDGTGSVERVKITVRSCMHLFTADYLSLMYCDSGRHNNNSKDSLRYSNNPYLTNITQSFQGLSAATSQNSNRPAVKASTLPKATLSVLMTQQGECIQVSPRYTQRCCRGRLDIRILQIHDHMTKNPLEQAVDEVPLKALYQDKNSLGCNNNPCPITSTPFSPRQRITLNH
jgi:hypothetical protein